MKCDKCGGLVVRGDEEGELKCLSCSKRIYRQEDNEVETKTVPSERARCTKGKCQDFAADDSVRCPYHRDMKKAMNDRFKNKGQPSHDKPKRKYTRRALTPPFPPVAGRAPIALAEPRIIKPRQITHANGDRSVLSMIDTLLLQLGEDTSVLLRAKELLEHPR